MKLVLDVDYIRPYFPKIIPLLQKALSDPSREVQREAAKAIAQFAVNIPDVEAEMIPFLKNMLGSDDDSGIVF